MILVDTSVWIEVLRRRAPFDLERTVSLDEVVTCLPVIQEILQGISDPSACRVAHDRYRTLMNELLIVREAEGGDLPVRSSPHTWSD
jgi:predicted nucleic acid-binding protein